MSLLLLVCVPAVAGAALGLIGAPADRRAAPVGVAVGGVTAALTLVCISGRPSLQAPFVAGGDLGLAVDALAALVLPAVAFVTLLVLLFSAGQVHEARARFFGLMLLFEAAALVMVTATTLVTVLVAFEVMGATSYALIGSSWREPSKTGAARVAFLTTRATDLGLYLAAGAALAGTGTMALVDLPTAEGRWLDVATAGIVVAALGKAAQLPFSFWLSRAMHGPSPVSALLHSAAMVAMGGYLLLRVAPTLAATGWADSAAAWTGAATALLLGLVALAQSDLKQLLAASTAAQLGFVVLAAGVGATAGGASHLVAHAAVKAGLFLAAGVWLEALGTKRLGSLTGAARVWPVVGACSAVALLSLAGLPPLALWATKDAVLTAALEESVALYVLALAGAALSAAYAGKALVVLARPLPKDAESGWDDERNGTRTAPARAQGPLVPLALGAVVLGALALPPAAEHVRRLAGGPGDAEPSVVELLISGLVALVVLAATWTAVRRSSRHVRWPRGLTDWLRLEWLAHRVVVTPVEVLARRLAHLDDAVLDRGVEAVAHGTMRLTGVAARVDDHAIDRSVGVVVAGVRRLGGLARRPQTGQLHQYYLQALAVLAVALLVLVLVR